MASRETKELLVEDKKVKKAVKKVTPKKETPKKEDKKE